MSVFVLGSYVSAHCLCVERLPAAGESLAAHSLQVECGGKGLNLAVGLNRLGLPVEVLLAVGNDAAGAALLELLHTEGLDARWVIKAGAHSGFGVGLIAAGGQNVIAVYPGANALLDAHHVQATLAGLDRGGHGIQLVCGQFEIPQAPVLEAFQWARSRQIKTLLNPSPWRELPPQLLECTDILVLNELEAECLLGLQTVQREPEQWLVVLEQYAWPGEWLVVTLAERGCVARAHAAAVHVPAYRIQAQDATGAGDAFAVGLAYACLQEWPLLDSLRFANACGALVAASSGVLAALPEMRQVADFMQHAMN